MAKNKQDRYEQIKRFESDLSQCMKCGFCTFFLPRVSGGAYRAFGGPRQEHDDKGTAGR